MANTFNRLAILILAGVWSGLASAGGEIMVENAWIRQAPPGASALAGYMSLHNQGKAPRYLVGAGSSAFGNVMLHRTVMEDGLAKMVHQMAVEIPAGESVRFEPNGYHIMLLKPVHALVAGDQVDITLEFRDGETMSVAFEVRGGKDGMGAMHH